jgi:hypothetical protein
VPLDAGAGNITISATPSVGSIKWYDALLDGNGNCYRWKFFSISNSLTINNLATTTTCYAESVDGTCASMSIAVTATVSTSAQLQCKLLQWSNSS